MAGSGVTLVTCSGRAQPAACRAMRVVAAIGLAALLSMPASPCEDIAVMSSDAKYMLLDGETLAPLDVGDLRWMGVYRVERVLPGSTAARFAIRSDRLSAQYAQPDESGSFQRSALVAIANLAERDGTSSEIAISHDYRFSVGDAVWVDGADQLLVREEERSRVALLDVGLNEVGAWSAAAWDTAPVAACRRGRDLFVAAGTHRTTRRGREAIVERLAVPDGFADCRVAERAGRFVDSLSTGCRATLGCRHGERHMNVIVDIADNEVAAWHTSSAELPREGTRGTGSARNYLASALLFTGGNRILRQQEIWIPDPPGSSDSFRRVPGPLLRAVDAENGRSARDNALAPLGTVSRVFCRGATERTTLVGNRRIHLIDLDTLDTIASSPIPFDRPFVF